MVPRMEDIIKQKGDIRLSGCTVIISILNLNGFCCYRHLKEKLGKILSSYRIHNTLESLPLRFLILNKLNKNKLFSMKDCVFEVFGYSSSCCQLLDYCVILTDLALRDQRVSAS